MKIKRPVGLLVMDNRWINTKFNEKNENNKEKKIWMMVSTLHEKRTLQIDLGFSLRTFLHFIELKVQKHNMKIHTVATNHKERI